MRSQGEGEHPVGAAVGTNSEVDRGQTAYYRRLVTARQVFADNWLCSAQF